MSVIFGSHGRISRTHPGIFVVLLIIWACSPAAAAQNEEISRKLEGFDQYMEKILQDWNAPGVAAGVVGKDDGALFLVFSGQQPEKLIAYKGLQFRIQRFSDFIFEFVVDNGQVTALKQRSPVGEYTFPRR